MLCKLGAESRGRTRGERRLMAEPRATLCALPLPPPRGLRKPDHRDFFLGCECVCASCVCVARRGYAHGMFCGDALYASIQGTRGWPSGMRVLVVVAPHLRTVFMYRCRCAFGRVVFVFLFFSVHTLSRRTKLAIHSPQRSHRALGHRAVCPWALSRVKWWVKARLIASGAKWQVIIT